MDKVDSAWDMLASQTIRTRLDSIHDDVRAARTHDYDASKHSKLYTVQHDAPPRDATENIEVTVPASVCLEYAWVSVKLEEDIAVATGQLSASAWTAFATTGTVHKLAAASKSMDSRHFLFVRVRGQTDAVCICVLFVYDEAAVRVIHDNTRRWGLEMKGMCMKGMCMMYTTAGSAGVYAKNHTGSQTIASGDTVEYFFRSVDDHPVTSKHSHRDFNPVLVFNQDHSKICITAKERADHAGVGELYYMFTGGSKTQWHLSCGNIAPPADFKASMSLTLYSTSADRKHESNKVLTFDDITAASDAKTLFRDLVSAINLEVTHSNGTKENHIESTITTMNNVTVFQLETLYKDSADALKMKVDLSCADDVKYVWTSQPIQVAKILEDISSTDVRWKDVQLDATDNALKSIQYIETTKNQRHYVYIMNCKTSEVMPLCVIMSCEDGYGVTLTETVHGNITVALSELTLCRHAFGKDCALDILSTPICGDFTLVEGQGARYHATTSDGIVVLQPRYVGCFVPRFSQDESSEFHIDTNDFKTYSHNDCSIWYDNGKSVEIVTENMQFKSKSAPIEFYWKIKIGGSKIKQMTVFELTPDKIFDNDVGTCWPYVSTGYELVYKNPEEFFEDSNCHYESKKNLTTTLNVFVYFWFCESLTDGYRVSPVFVHTQTLPTAEFASLSSSQVSLESGVYDKYTQPHHTLWYEFDSGTNWQPWSAADFSVVWGSSRQILKLYWKYRERDIRTYEIPLSKVVRRPVAATGSNLAFADFTVGSVTCGTDTVSDKSSVVSLSTNPGAKIYTISRDYKTHQIAATVIALECAKSLEVCLLEMDLTHTGDPLAENLDDAKWIPWDGTVATPAAIEHPNTRDNTRMYLIAREKNATSVMVCVCAVLSSDIYGWIPTDVPDDPRRRKKIEYSGLSLFKTLHHNQTSSWNGELLPGDVINYHIKTSDGIEVVRNIAANFRPRFTRVGRDVRMFTDDHILYIHGSYTCEYTIDSGSTWTTWPGSATEKVTHDKDDIQVKWIYVQYSKPHQIGLFEVNEFRTASSPVSHSLTSGEISVTCTTQTDNEFDDTLETLDNGVSIFCILKCDDDDGFHFSLKGSPFDDSKPNDYTMFWEHCEINEIEDKSQTISWGRVDSYTPDSIKLEPLTALGKASSLYVRDKQAGTTTRVCVVFYADPSKFTGTVPITVSDISTYSVKYPKLSLCHCYHDAKQTPMYTDKFTIKSGDLLSYHLFVEYKQTKYRATAQTWICEFYPKLEFKSSGRKEISLCPGEFNKYAHGKLTLGYNAGPDMDDMTSLDAATVIQWDWTTQTPLRIHWICSGISDSMCYKEYKEADVTVATSPPPSGDTALLTLILESCKVGATAGRDGSIEFTFDDAAVNKFGNPFTFWVMPMAVRAAHVSSQSEYNEYAQDPLNRKTTIKPNTGTPYCYEIDQKSWIIPADADSASCTFGIMARGDSATGTFVYHEIEAGKLCTIPKLSVSVSVSGGTLAGRRNHA